MLKKIARFILAVITMPLTLIFGLILGIITMVITTIETMENIFNDILYGVEKKNYVKMKFRKLENGNYEVQKPNGKIVEMTEDEFINFSKSIKENGGEIYGKERDN